MKTLSQKPIQLNLFESTVLDQDYLIAGGSPRGAFYRIWLIHNSKSFSVKKESGTSRKTLNTREWVFNNIELAEKFYSQKIRQKTNPNRKTRKYSRTSV